MTYFKSRIIKEGNEIVTNCDTFSKSVVSCSNDLQYKYLDKKIIITCYNIGRGIVMKDELGRIVLDNYLPLNHYTTGRKEKIWLIMAIA